jgi:hypothetical protein
MTSAKPNKVVLWSPHNATQFVVASQTMRLYMASADQDSASSDTLGFQQLPPPLQSPAFISTGAGLVASAAGKPVSASPSALQDQGADEYKEAKYDGSPASLDEGARDAQSTPSPIEIPPAVRLAAAFRARQVVQVAGHRLVSATIRQGLHAYLLIAAFAQLKLVAAVPVVDA